MPDQILSPADTRAPRSSRRPTSHYNAFQTMCSTATDEPPTYLSAMRFPYQRPMHYPDERLPAYSCTVETEGKFLLSVESTNPLHGTSEADWKESYLVLCGTMLTLYRFKDGAPGKPFKTYTLQHAEVGLATDSEHNVLIPQTRLAHFVPALARRRASQKDADMFRVEKQTLLRLRVETDQILIAHSSEERIHDLINSLSAAIDISCPIDERSVPKICTVPRRRRTRRAGQHGSTDMRDPTLRAEQDRIMREMYPTFAEDALSPTSPTSAIREEDDIDLAIMREDVPVFSRPPMSRRSTTSSVDSVHITDPINLNSAGKWEPPHPRTAEQILRYIRRCMPVLHADAVRASDICISNGQRAKVNWRMQVLEEFELKPPSYRSHHFGLPNGVARRASEISQHSSRSSYYTARGSIVSQAIEEGEIYPLVKTLSSHDEKNDSLNSPQTPIKVDEVISPHNPNGAVFIF